MASATLGAGAVAGEAIPQASHGMWRSLHEALNRHADPRTTSWPLMHSPVPTFLIVFFYIYFVKVAGPRLMEKRKPFELKNVLVVYNFVQVVLSVWLFWGTLRIALVERYSVVCQPVDRAMSGNGKDMAIMTYAYYLAKLTELLDTVFFVMRKKFNQVSPLHVFHHSVMPLNSWMATKYVPGGHVFSIGVINSFVHIVMYSYYLLAAMGPAIQPYLWWKKYITQMQLIQFVFLTLHALAPLLVECEFPRAMAYWTSLHTIYFWFLFKSFYQDAYKSRAAKAAKAAQAAQNQASPTNQEATTPNLKSANLKQRHTANLHG